MQPLDGLRSAVPRAAAFIRDGGEGVVYIMRTHSMVIFGGVLQRKPFFVPPERFNVSFRHRREKQASRGRIAV